MNLDLFPEIEPYASEYLSVGDGHELYIEQCGRASGAPILVVHGGPGSGCTPTLRRFFDPDYYRIILFDQRGSNRSRPLASLHANTPDHLVEDIEKIRAHLGIEQWHVFGGSWGSTLGLLYGEAYPERCLSLTLRGIFMMRKSEIEWLFAHAKNIFPEEWALFIDHLPERYRGNPLRGYYELLRSTDHETVLAATRAWNRYENACSYLMPTPEAISGPLDDSAGISRAAIECHYFLNELFTPDDRILQNAGRLRGIPATIIQGRYDIICPFTSAYELHQVWPEAEFIAVPDSGHASNDPAMRSALIAATERLKTSGI